MVFQHRLTMGFVNLTPHILAALLALIFAWYVSQTSLVTTGVQFVAPLLIIFLWHTIWLCLPGHFPAGIFDRIYLRTTKTALGLAGVISVICIFAPEPAHTGQIAEGDFSGLLSVMVCLAIVVIIVAIFALGIIFLFKIIRAGLKSINNNQSNDHDTRLYDIGGILLSLIIMISASLEAVPGSYTFSSAETVSASTLIKASSEKVWLDLETATSPDFPLADLLYILPRPVEVLTDEGTHLHAKRKVKFKGRQGEGLLTLQVVKRTDTEVVFEALSDTSPIANWIQHKQITYKVMPEAAGSQLTVSLSYDRKLSPSWFFTPFTKGATYLAMDVLARDVKERAEY